VNVALLRGINVGGRNLLPMKELAALVADAGGRNVRTYIQSGNVLFDAGAAVAARMAAIVRKAIAKEFGFDVPIVLRTAEELARVVKSNPFPKETEALHVAFLADRPAVEALDPTRSPGDRFVVRGREVYLHLPNGVARTKLSSAYLDSKLATVCTIRNWKTVLKLLELAGGDGLSAS
jgi:uncharacterized protein (DUF1697 family)